MTAAADFMRSAGIAASSFHDFPGMTFTFAGRAIHLGSLKEIGPTDVEIRLSSKDIRKPEVSNVVGLVCFLADVRGVNLILDFTDPVEEQSLHRIKDMLRLHGFAACREADGLQAWCRLAKSVAA
jgi:hypothetical protein